jgi:SAM-dependent methyltransferase
MSTLVEQLNVVQKRRHALFLERMIEVMKLKVLRRRYEWHAKDYWERRLRHYGLDLRGVGNKSLSLNENQRMYEDAKKAFLKLCGQEQVDFSRVRVLDIGCGAGYYAKAFSEVECPCYLGIDITDVLFPYLSNTYPNYHFKQIDITKDSLEGKFDLIIMIDVTQHITSDRGFKFAMQNIRTHLEESGCIIITSWLSKTARQSHYERSRHIEDYEKQFPGWLFSYPRPFRDKFIFTVRKDQI